jgi:hypothetical protein
MTRRAPTAKRFGVRRQVGRDTAAARPGRPAQTLLPGGGATVVGRVAMGALGSHRAPSLWTRSSPGHAELSQLGSLTPFPGTPIFRKLEEEGRILSYDWSKYNARTDAVFRPPQMTPDQLQAGVEWVTKQFYSLKSISRRLLAGIRTGLWWNIPRNLGCKTAFDKLGRRGYNPGQLSPMADRPGLILPASAGRGMHFPQLCSSTTR